MKENFVMNREFHIFASDFDTRFTIKGIKGRAPREFPSLFEAARHARGVSGNEDGFVVIYDQTGKAVNRIPLRPQV
jgi:hypothetical protein